jgi:hypothetical protein
MNRLFVKACVAGLVLTLIMLVGVALALAQTPVPVKIVDAGTLAGQVLTWTVTTFGGLIGVVGAGLLVRMMNNAGIVGASLLSDRLQGIIVNGLNAAASTASQALAGKGQIDFNAVVNSTVSYVQQHGLDTLKRLGVDPTSPQAIDAIKARITTAIINPATPTHPALAAALAATSPASGGKLAWAPSPATAEPAASST